MKRTIRWAVVAFYPLVAIAAASLLGERVDAYYSRQTAVSSVEGFIASYWWTCVVITEIIVIGIFVASALRNHVLPVWSRILWALAMVFLGALTVPLYWWMHTEPS